MCNIINVSGDALYTDVICNLEQMCFPDDYWSREAVLSELGKKNTYFMIAYDCNEPIGYFCLSFLLGEAELERICVLPDFRRGGTGSKMLSYAMDFLKSQNCSKFMLEVRSKNSKAIGLYKKFNFEVDYIRKKYYQNPTDDAVLMTYTFQNGGD